MKKEPSLTHAFRQIAKRTHAPLSTIIMLELKEDFEFVSKLFDLELTLEEAFELYQAARSDNGLYEEFVHRVAEQKVLVHLMDKKFLTKDRTINKVLECIFLHTQSKSLIGQRLQEIEIRRQKILETEAIRATMQKKFKQRRGILRIPRLSAYLRGVNFKIKRFAQQRLSFGF